MLDKLKELWNRWNVHVKVVGGVLVVAAAWGTCTYEPNLSPEVQEDAEEVAPVEDASTETVSSEDLKARVDSSLVTIVPEVEDLTVKSTASELKDDFEKMMAGEYTNDVISTHLPQLDSMLGNGGIGLGEVFTLSAPTSCGVQRAERRIVALLASPASAHTAVSMRVDRIVEH